MVESDKHSPDFSSDKTKLLMSSAKEQESTRTKSPYTLAALVGRWPPPSASLLGVLRLGKVIFKVRG